MKSMDMSHTAQISGARGTKILKSTGLDGSSMKVSGADTAQLKGAGMKGGRDDLSHSISGSKVGDNK